MPIARPPRRRLVVPAGPELSRRRMLGSMGALAGIGLLGPTVLTACGGDDDGESSSGGGDTSALRFDNWPAYIDEETVELFREASGLEFTYNEGFNDNNEYFARFQSDLAAGRDIGTDIIAPTYWMAGRLITLGWVQELDFEAIPNAANLVESLQNPAWDPDGTYSLPWQAGMTGIAYNAAATGRDLTSLEDLFDPEFSGKIGMLTEMRDTVGLMMLLDGKDPAEATFDDAQGAFDRIQAAKDDGTIRQFTGNDYMDDLASGNFVACIGWSGDISQLALENPDLKFVIPDEGGISWSDTMLVPNGAENAGNVAEWMDYVYDPENAARITEFVGYNSPVEGVQDIFADGTDDQKALAESPLLFPDEATLDRLRSFANLDEDEEAAFDERFAEITGA